MKARKIPIDWYQAEPSMMNAMEFEEVIIDRVGVTCHYSSIFDKEIAVGNRGKKQPINPFKWRVARDGKSTWCRENINACAFMNFDQESLEAMVNIVKEVKEKARKEKRQKEREAFKQAQMEEPQELIDEESEGDEESAEEEKSSNRVIIF